MQSHSGQTWSRRRRLAVGILGLILSPLLIATAYLLVTRAASLPSDYSDLDYVALGVSILTGAGFIFLLPLHLSIRIVAAIVYLPVAAWALFGFMLGVVCGVFGNCL